MCELSRKILPAAGHSSQIDVCFSDFFPSVTPFNMLLAISNSNGKLASCDLFTSKAVLI